MANKPTRLAGILKSNEQDVLKEWTSQQLAATGRRLSAAEEAAIKSTSKEFLGAFTEAAQGDGLSNPENASWKEIREFLTNLSSMRAREGFTPSETAMFVFSLKEPLFKLYRDAITDPKELLDEIRAATIVIDHLGLFTTEAHQKTREDIISRQQQELLELS